MNLESLRNQSAEFPRAQVLGQNPEVLVKIIRDIRSRRVAPAIVRSSRKEAEKEELLAILRGMDLRALLKEIGGDE